MIIVTNRHPRLASSLAVAFGLILSGCSGRTPAVPVDQAPSIPVRTEKLVVRDIDGTFEAGGVVQARTTATIMARILAPVREVVVAAGDRVRAGQPLVVLDGRDLAAQSRSAQSVAIAAEQSATAAVSEQDGADASLALARATHERMATLQSKGSATTQELDDATGLLRAAEARRAAAAARTQAAVSVAESARASGDAARLTDAFALITAPFDGLVAEKMIESGNMASPGTPLLRLEDTRSFRLDVRVNQSRIGAIAKGDGVSVALDSGAGGAVTMVAGTVAEIDRAIDADSRAFLVKITLPKTNGVHSGVFGRVQFREGTHRGLTVPPDALVQRGQITTVLVADKGIARVRLVNVSGTEVLAGLSEGDMVILAPPPTLTDGSHITTGQP